MSAYENIFNINWKIHSRN